MKKLVMFLMLILFLQFVLADTTFFEGDYDYRDDFIIGEIASEEIVETPADEEQEILQEVLGRTEIQLDKEIVCEVCSESLKKHIKKYRNINYSEEELKILSLEITNEIGVSFSHEQVAVLVENFEEECSKPYPLLGGLAAGRSRDLLSSLIIFISSLVLAFFVFLYLMFRRLRKRKKSSKKKK